MFTDSQSFIISMVAVSVMVIATILIHYEAMWLISKRLMKIKALSHRYLMLYSVLGLFAAHTAEVWVYAFGYWFLIDVLHIGSLYGEFSGSAIHSYIYYSIVSYTSLGLGDVFPSEHLRLITGVEALNGLLLIAWSGAYTWLIITELGRARFKKHFGTDFFDKP